MASVTTTLLVSNLHCSSCVTTIRDALSSLSPPPTSINTSIVSQTVSVEHSPQLSSDTIKDALDDAGFDLVSTPKLEAFRLRPSPSFKPEWLAKKREKHAEQCLLCQQDQATGQPNYTSSDTLAPVPSHVPSITATLVHPNTLSKQDKRLSNATDPSPQPMDDALFNVAFSVGGMTCASCVGNITRALEDIQGISDVAVNLVGKSATAMVNNKDLVKDIKEAIEESGYDADLISVEPVKSTVPRTSSSTTKKEEGPYHATFFVGGMTCASCVGNIIRATSELAGVADVSVNLVGKSATATLENKDLVNDFINAVEDSGYECQLVSIEPLNGDVIEESGPRSIALRVDGMFCKHCPEKVLTALKKFGDSVSVDDPLPDYPTPNPIIRLSYKPSLPGLTIRSIISTIESAKSPPFEVSIARPPSLEERARRMHIREQLNLLYRLLSAVIIAIPTFIIAVVFMSLIPSTNSTRKFFMQPMWSGNTSRIQWALFFLATPVMFYSAGQFHRRSLKEIWGLWRPGSKAPLLRRFVRFGSMNLLVSMGVSIAYFASIALLALAASQPPSPTGMGDTTTYFDSVVFLTMFLLCGRYLEAYSKGRTADAVDALGKLRPSEALLLVPDSVIEIDHAPQSTTDVDVEKGEIEDEAFRSEKLGMRVKKVRAELLEIGDVVRVPHGASPPADGVVVSVEGGSFDESSLTGESKPVKKANGDRVFVGTINRGKVVEIKIDTLGGETMLDRIVKVVRDGQAKRAPIERLADVLTGYFIPVITFLAILTWIIWLVLGVSGVLPSDYLDIPIGGWTVWALEFAIAVFVVACPCGIGLAAPTALLVGSGLAAKFGILVRGGGEAFQEAAQLDLIVFDKTGTLTVGGEPQITDSVLDLSGVSWSRGEIFNAMHTLESASSHPLAAAVKKFCEEEKDIKLVDIGTSNVEEIAGKGLKGTFSNPDHTAIIGNEDWMSAHGAELTAIQDEQLAKWKNEGKSVILMAMSKGTNDPESKFNVVAILGAADELRPEAKVVVTALQKHGLSTWMISGDNAITAKAVAKTVGIPETNVIAGVLPHQKAEKVAWLQQVGLKREQSRWQRLLGLKRLNDRCIVAMVGDGINDAPALTSADVGIAVGSGSDVAISSASFILIKSNLQSILTLTDLSRKVFNRVKFNFVWALMYNLAALPIAAGVIYPAGHARLNPVWASLAMALSSVTVVSSSLLLRLYKAPKI